MYDEKTFIRTYKFKFGKNSKNDKFMIDNKNVKNKDRIGIIKT